MPSKLLNDNYFRYKFEAIYFSILIIDITHINSQVRVYLMWGIFVIILYYQIYVISSVVIYIVL